jgi:urease accessory protein
VTVVGIDARPGRAALHLVGGPLTGKVLSVGPDRARIGLVATEALLLGGDDVRIDVRVGPGAHLELVEMAGVVAYHGRGRPASWTVHVHVAENATLTWHGEPFVVCDGAEVSRFTTIDLDLTATALLRETLVFGRAGETGGSLHTRTRVSAGGEPMLAEDLALGPAQRAAVGVLGGPAGVDRVVDSIQLFGRRQPRTQSAQVTWLDLDQPGAVIRWTGIDLASSPMPDLWPALGVRTPLSGPAGTMET